MSTSRWLDIFALTLAAVAIGAIAFKNYEGDTSGQILNVSYDATREVYKEINPKSLLAAWGSVIYRGGSEDQARDFVRNLYQHVPILGQGARDSSTMFALAKEGDVHLTWENEALREVTESKGELETVYPAVSILAEPSVTWVDANVEKHKSGSTAKAYLEYLFTDAAQEIFARDGCRPINEAILQEHRNRLPNIRLFPIAVVAKDWADAQEKFFGEDGIYATIQSAPTK